MQASAAHALLAVGHSAHLDPALNTLTMLDGEREAALRYLAQLSERASRAESSTEIAKILTEIAGPTEGLLPLPLRDCRQGLDRLVPPPGAMSEDPTPAFQLGTTPDTLSHAVHRSFSPALTPRAPRLRRGRLSAGRTRDPRRQVQPCRTDTGASRRRLAPRTVPA
ncbi:hypothetical protein [Streptomyces sp. JJ38]|uniref:hypothetical protein n=1 Tax=Streptomyces sp. JJ38 TaxID=2738128 RepID=UPI001C578E17|nr:hypothetical protein [Streptomyces sp. JJ38]MBW1597299.1 hypothetical protein [Streptomyces sp. JJ38]